MLRVWSIATLVILFCCASGCDSGPHSGNGLRLPSSGAPERGRIAFISHDCHSCHTVGGVDLPRSTAMATAPIPLGGETFHQVTDGYLVTSIVNPSYVLAAHARQQPRDGSPWPHMPEYGEKLTVQELVDIVAFLQSRYSVQQAPRYPASF